MRYTDVTTVHDLPQLYTKPSFDRLLATLELLRLVPSTFVDEPNNGTTSSGVHPEGVPHYLTSIVSSSLGWLENDDEREQVWNQASARLSERAGRNAMPSMTRSFRINDDLTIDLFEPSLTEDNLGLKTWTSSLLLSKRLDKLRRHIPPCCTKVLELGAGTGLVGITASYIWDVDVVLTDLPEIVPNLRKNVESNLDLRFGKHSVTMEVRPLDWSDADSGPLSEGDRFMVIVAADPIYTSNHPPMLADTVQRWMSRSSKARFIVELPLRKGYESERDSLRECLQTNDMELIEEDTELGFDDWQASDGRPLEVECWWSVWRPKMAQPSHRKH